MMLQVNGHVLYIQLGLGTEDDSAFNRREGDFSVPHYGTNMNDREDKVGAAIPYSDLMLDETRTIYMT